MRILALIALTACGEAPIHGRLVDAAHADAPIGGEVILAKAVGTVELTCQTLTGTTDTEGKFTIPGLCLGQTAYKLEPSNEALFLADADTVDAAGTEILLRAWWVPPDDGVHILRGSVAIPVVPNTDLRTVRIGDESVLYPTSMPDVPPTIGPTDELVLGGAEFVESLVIEPLVANEARTFGTVTMSPWSYLGVKFTSDTTFERIVANPDPSGIHDLSPGGRVLRYVPGTALPPGKYVLFREGSRRATIVQFGPTSSAP